MDDYNLKKLDEARIYIDEVISFKLEYKFSDIFKLLKSFGYTLQLDLDSINSYIPSNKQYFESISDFTSNYILDSDNFKIYAINEGPFFTIFVISMYNGKVKSYFCNNITNKSLDICFKLEYLKL